MGLRVDYDDLSDSHYSNTDSETDDINSCPSCHYATATTTTPPTATITTKIKTIDQGTSSIPASVVMMKEQHQQHQQYQQQEQGQGISNKKPNVKKNRMQYFQVTSNGVNGAKDLIDNNKEFRIETNNTNLRIVGNNNRVKITNNNAKIHVIGNSTKVKIIQNNSRIQYTGNNGRIYLGSDSKEQSIDYIGCNGILKIIDPEELKQQQKQQQRKSKKSTNNDDYCNVCGFRNNSHNKTTTKTTTTTIAPMTQLTIVNSNPVVQLSSTTTSTSASSSSSSPTTTSLSVDISVPQIRIKSKSASYGGDGDFKNKNWQKFSELLQQTYSKISLPNLNENNLNEKSKNLNCKKESQKPNLSFSAGNHLKINSIQCKNYNTNSRNSRIVNNFGNIAIKNSTNISIA